MLSAIVLAFSPPGASPDAALLRERVARSLSSLVDACVHGLVADATVVGPAQFSLSDVADEAGCALVETSNAREGLSAALKSARHAHVFMLEAGYAVDRGFVEEMSDLFAFGDVSRARVLRAEPNSLVTRLTPSLAAPVGIMARKAEASAANASDILALAKTLRAVDLASKARRAL
jgi:hypothetical protein